MSNKHDMELLCRRVEQLEFTTHLLRYHLGARPPGAAAGEVFFAGSTELPDVPILDLLLAKHGLRVSVTPKNTSLVASGEKA